MEFADGLDVVPKRYCQNCDRGNRQFDWFILIFEFGLIGMSIAGALGCWNNSQLPARELLTAIFSLIAFGLAFALWIRRHPTHWLMTPLRKRHARKFLREWSVARIERDGPYAIEPWDRSLVGEYRDRFINLLPTASNSLCFESDADLFTKKLDRLAPGWFDEVYESVLNEFAMQLPQQYGLQDGLNRLREWLRGGFNGLRKLLDHYRPG